MMKSYTIGVLTAFVAAAVVSGCDKDASPTSNAHASTAGLSATAQTEPEPKSRSEAPAPDAESEAKPPPEWSLQVSGPLAASKHGRSAAYTYIDQSLHMRLLHNPSIDRFGQGLTFHLPQLAMGYEGPAEANYARLELGDEGLSCSTQAEDTSFLVELRKFNRDVRVGTFEGRLLCEPQSDEDEPKYVDISGSFRDD